MPVCFTCAVGAGLELWRERSILFPRPSSLSRIDCGGRLVASVVVVVVLLVLLHCAARADPAGYCTCVKPLVSSDCCAVATKV